MAYSWKLPALKIRQGENRVLYSFAVKGKTLTDFATISRIRRNGKNTLEGCQLPEVLSHIAEIRKHIESENPMIPNAIIIAFDDRVSFEPQKANKKTKDSITTFGHLIVPIVEPDSDKPGWSKRRRLKTL
jgi:DNA sulfur modification protein DndB